MRYPKFIKENDIIGICAPSAGVGDKMPEFILALENIHNEGYKTIVTNSVINDDSRSADALTRANELNSLLDNKDVKIIVCAKGGDYMVEMLPFVDFKKIANSGKWLMGYSDPTNILFPLTCGFDIATIYGMNAKSYSDKDETYLNNIEIIKGNIIDQSSFKHYHHYKDYDVNPMPIREVEWKSKYDFVSEGRLIGGCFDVIAKLIGTEYDYVNNFIEKYRDDGIIWYFDIFATSAYDTYLSLLQMKYAGYFKYAKTILIGRIAFENNDDNPGISYEDAFEKAFDDIPYVRDVDIGHVSPSFTLINGSYAYFEYKDNKGKIKQVLK